MLVAFHRREWFGSIGVLLTIVADVYAYLEVFLESIWSGSEGKIDYRWCLGSATEGIVLIEL